MSNPYIGEIRMFAGNFAPQGWLFCQGQLLSVSDYDTLYNLIGTTYGGDGVDTFAIPDLQGRVPMHAGRGPSGTVYPLSAKGGTEQETLTTQQLAAHTHPFTASTAAGTANSPEKAVLATSPDVTMYIKDTPIRALPTQLIGPAGGSQPHDNLMPTLAMNFIISLFGIYPSQD